MGTKPGYYRVVRDTNYGSGENLKGWLELDLENSESTQLLETIRSNMQTSSFNKMNVGAVVKAKTQDKDDLPCRSQTCVSGTILRSISRT